MQAATSSRRESRVTTGGVRQSRPIKPSGRANHSARVVTRAMWRKSAGALNFETLREVEKLGHREARNFGLIVGVSTGKSRLGDLFGQRGFGAVVALNAVVGALQTQQFGIAHRLDAVLKILGVLAFGGFQKAQDFLGQLGLGTEFVANLL